MIIQQKDQRCLANLTIYNQIILPDSQTDFYPALQTVTKGQRTHERLRNICQQNRDDQAAKQQSCKFKPTHLIKYAN